MKTVLDLIDRVDSETQDFAKQEFIAPVSLGGDIVISIAGIVQKLSVRPKNFNGWGIFRCDGKMERAYLESEATYADRMEYLKYFRGMHVVLIRRIADLTWLAYPANEGEMQNCFRSIKPIMVRLAEGVGAMESVVARFDGVAWWYCEQSSHVRPSLAIELQEQLITKTDPEELRISGLTPEMRTAYGIARGRILEEELRLQELEREQHEEERRQREAMRHKTDEERLRGALQLAGGSLDSMRERGDSWTIEWRTQNGDHQVSTIDKRDLTIVSSGICLSGGDRAFDLSSLVGVIERRPRW